MKVNGPRDLPDLRLELLERWRPGGALRAAARLINPLSAQRNGLGDEFSIVEPVFDQRALEQSTLWYVTEDMGSLVAAAAPTLPPTTLTAELMPAPCGLAVFAEPLQGLAADDFGPEMDAQGFEVHALLWGDSETLKTRIARRRYVGISAYRAVDMMGTVEWMPLGRTDWNYGDDTEEAVDPRLKGHDRRLASMAEDRRWIATLWLLAAQARVGEQSAVPLPRPIARRSQRAGYPAEVKLVDVRRAPSVTHEDGEERTVEWSHRWMVRPHWRQQAYGPGRSLRKPRFIPPHVKGPDDKPLITKPTVRVVKP